MKLWYFTTNLNLHNLVDKCIVILSLPDMCLTCNITHSVLMLCDPFNIGSSQWRGLVSSWGNSLDGFGFQFYFNKWWSVLIYGTKMPLKWRNIFMFTYQSQMSKTLKNSSWNCFQIRESHIFLKFSHSGFYLYSLWRLSCGCHSNSFCYMKFCCLDF